MILTVCPNPALDKIIFIDRWTSGIPMRTDKMVVCVGGKGLNSSVALRHFGLDTTAMGFFSGETGRELVSILEDYGINPLPIWVDGETRVSHVIAETETQIHSHVITGDVIITSSHIEEFNKQFIASLPSAEWIIFGGSLPASLPDDFYTSLIVSANNAGVPCLIDSQKAFLREGIKARPDIVKMNREEFEWTFQKKADSLEQLIIQARDLISTMAIESLVLTLSKDGILAFTPEGDFHATAPFQVPINAAGAGDSASSTLVWKLSKGESWETALRWAAAASAASVLSERTADINLHDVDRILPEVKISIF